MCCSNYSSLQRQVPSYDCIFEWVCRWIVNMDSRALQLANTHQEWQELHPCVPRPEDSWSLLQMLSSQSRRRQALSSRRHCSSWMPRNRLGWTCKTPRKQSCCAAASHAPWRCVINATAACSAVDRSLHSPQYPREITRCCHGAPADHTGMGLGTTCRCPRRRLRRRQR